MTPCLEAKARNPGREDGEEEKPPPKWKLVTGTEGSPESKANLRNGYPHISLTAPPHLQPIIQASLSCLLGIRF